jgi:hypothetical protein
MATCSADLKIPLETDECCASIGISFQMGWIVLVEGNGRVNRKLFFPELVIYLLSKNPENRELVICLCQRYYATLDHYGHMMELTLFISIESHKSGHSIEKERRKRTFLLDEIFVLKQTCFPFIEGGVPFYGRILVNVLRKMDPSIWMPYGDIFFGPDPLVFLHECIAEKQWAVAVNYLPILSQVYLMINRESGDQRTKLARILGRLIEHVRQESDSSLLLQIQRFIEMRAPESKQLDGESILASLVSVLYIE